ncbi:MAG: hypothetical protein GEU83_00005, partial [Pseudonocardiaceae bacterium]|nr:hypothetical protein [Pseudonocardiaceae bacterium]
MLVAGEAAHRIAERVRDLAQRGGGGDRQPQLRRPVTLVWIKRVWRCPHRLCPKRTWTETSPVIAPRAWLTEQARAEICRRVGQDGASVAATARDFGVGWRTAMAAVREHGTPRVEDPDRLVGIAALGLDETAFAAASATRSTSFVTGIVNLTRGRGSARLLDVVADRSASALVRWMHQREDELAPVARTPDVRWPRPPGRMSRCLHHTHLSSVSVPLSWLALATHRSQSWPRSCVSAT